MEIQKVKSADLEAVKSLIATVSENDVLPMLSEEGQAEYKNIVLPDIETTFDESKFVAIKVTFGGNLIGFGALRDGNYLTHLFVSKSAQGTGLGCKLLSTLLSSTDAKEISLRSSVNAVGFYRRNGFEATGDESDFKGIRFVPMTLIRT